MLAKIIFTVCVPNPYVQAKLVEVYKQKTISCLSDPEVAKWFDALTLSDLIENVPSTYKGIDRNKELTKAPNQPSEQALSTVIMDEETWYSACAISRRKEVHSNNNKVRLAPLPLRQTIVISSNLTSLQVHPLTGMHAMMTRPGQLIVSSVQEAISNIDNSKPVFIVGNIDIKMPETYYISNSGIAFQS